MATAAQDEFNNLMRDKSRPTHHPSDRPDSDDAASFLDDASDDDRTPAASVQDSLATTRTRATYKIPTQRQQSNTGVKGVITDAQAYRDAARSRPSMNASRTSLGQHGHGGAGYVQGPDGRVYAVPEEGNAHWNAGANKENVDSDEEDLDDDGFMEEWRRERLRQLQGGSKILGGRRRDRDAARTRFGGIVPVDGEGYLEAVDGSGSSTVVVVFIYDDMSEVSSMVEDCLRSLARKYINTRFIKLHFQDAEMEPAGVPAVLAYRGGDKFAGLVPLVDEIPDDADLSDRTLERLMQRHQIL